MTDIDAQDERRRVAVLIVDVLMIGARNVDRLAGEFCAAFGIDLATMIDSQRGFSPEVQKATCDAVVAQLLNNAPDVRSMFEAFARHGGAVIDMVEGIYTLLAKHAATVGEPAKKFTVRLGADLELTISPAFIEQVRSVVERFLPIELGTVDGQLLYQLVRYDDGESYGSWPPESEDGRPLLHQIMALRPFRAHLAQRAATAPAFAAAIAEGEATQSAADRLVDRLERLLAGAGAYLLEADLDPPRDDIDRHTRQLDMLRIHGLFGARVSHSFFNDLDESAFLGIRVAGGDPLQPVTPEPVRKDDLIDQWGAALSYLGAYVAILRTGLTLRDERWLNRWGDPVKMSELVNATTPEPAIDWLRGLADAADRAQEWVDDVLWTPTARREVRVAVEDLEEMLRLPLWEKRHLLFELWLLCQTISTAAGSGWVPALGGMDGDVWTLPERSDTPVATLSAHDQTLEVWREPNRGVTPDITVSTTDLAKRHLVVVEAKDRHKMKTGLASDPYRPVDPEVYALGIAKRYVAALGPTVTWVCNHSKFSGDLANPDRNEGSPWHRVHMADEVAPGRVPEAFRTTISAALAVPTDRKQSTQALAAVFVLDTTQSMEKALGSIQAVLRVMPAVTCASYAAILFGDHDDDYVVRPVAAYPTPTALADAIEREPTTGGGDVPEALEDAMHHAAWLADGIHQVFIVATDAPPHRLEECPHGFQFASEVTAVLDSGASIVVVTDWFRNRPQEWVPFAQHARFSFTTLAELPRRLAAT